MTAVLSATNALRRDGIMGSLDDNQINYSSSPIDWRAKYNEVADMLAETRTELDDFHASSKELEEELERELERTEKAQQELRVKVAKADAERDEWKSKFMSLQTTHNTTTTSLQCELDKLRQEHQQTKIQLRELELGNDDLERNERAVSSSLAEEQVKYSRVLEEKILLEQELLGKANIEEEFQRLKDELRDANVEVSILRDQLAAAQANAATADNSPATSTSHFRRISTLPSEDNLLSTKPPPDLQLSELSTSEDNQSATEASHRQPDSLTAAIRQPSLLRRPSFNANTSIPSSGTSSLSRSSTLPSLSGTPSRIPPPSPVATPQPVTLRNHANLTNPAMISKNKGVQMVSEMRARVKNLEQKIHTRVPRLRMGSITARSNTNAISQSGSSASTPTNRRNFRASLSDEMKGRRSSESISGKKDKKSTNVPTSESSGWVLIMEDSPSPIKVKLTEKEKDQERRRASSPSAMNSFRPRASTSALSSANSNSKSNPLYHSSLGSTGLRRPQSRQSATSSATNGSSIPTPSSRPSTPTFLPVPSGGLHAPSSTAGLPGLKRSTGPGGSTIQQKRSSMGSIVRPGSRDQPAMPASSRLSTDSAVSISSSASNSSLNDRDNKALPQIPSHSNVTMRPPSKLPTSFLSQSRIGKPAPSGRRGSDASSGRRSSDLLTVDSGYADEEKEEKRRPRSGSIVSPFGFGKSKGG